MQSLVDHLPATVTYISPNGRHEKRHNADRHGGCLGVELNYYCPYCDAPNNAAYTTPIPGDLIHICQHCDRNIPLFGANDSSQKYANDFEDAAARVEALRRLRLSGEREGKIAQFLGWARTIEPVGFLLGSVFGAVSFPIVLSSGIIIPSILLSDPTTSGSILATTLVILSLLSFIVAFKARMLPARAAPDPLTETDLIRHSHLIDHGRKVATGAEQLYTPANTSDVKPQEKLRTEYRN